MRALAEWLVECELDEVVMESTAQYWRPVWEALKRPGNRARGRHGAARTPEAGFPDAERLVKRLVAQELTLSVVPDVTHCGARSRAANINRRAASGRAP